MVKDPVQVIAIMMGNENMLWIFITRNIFH